MWKSDEAVPWEPRPEGDQRGAKGEKKGRHEAIHQAMVRRGRGRRWCGMWNVGFNPRGWGVRKQLDGINVEVNINNNINNNKLQNIQ